MAVAYDKLMGASEKALASDEEKPEETEKEESGYSAEVLPSGEIKILKDGEEVATVPGGDMPAEPTEEGPTEMEEEPEETSVSLKDRIMKVSEKLMPGEKKKEEEAEVSTIEELRAAGGE